MGGKFSIRRVVRGGFWLYATSLTGSILGFLYWLVISKFTEPETLGYATTTTSIASLLTGVFSLGVARGMQRFIGIYLGRRNLDKVAEYLWSAFTFYACVYSLIAVSLASISFFNIGLDPYMLILAALMIVGGAGVAFNSFLIAILRTDINFLVSLVAGSLKFIVGVSLVIAGWGWVGATIGYLVASWTSLFLNGFFVYRFIGKQPFFSFDALKDSIIAGVAGWAPGVIVLVGQQVGLLTVFGVSGALESGLYYVATAISSVVLVFATSMLGLLFPVLSGMTDGRKRATARVLKISLAACSPAVAFTVVYPWLPLGLLGPNYIQASAMLQLLVVAVIPLAITSAVNSLVYAYGDYLKVFVIGSMQNIPRLALYSFLVPFLGGLGAALSFTTGAILGMITATVIAEISGFKINFKELALTVAPPLLTGVLAYFLNLHWLIGGSLILFLSLFLYAKLNIVTREDLKDIAHALMPGLVLNKTAEWVKPLLDLLYG
ncbi:MAG: hypothetical protein J7L38_06430 [Thermoproteales archaeon]|nr:hypothetical protein [Thermoproteales archaeon]